MDTSPSVQDDVLVGTTIDGRFQVLEYLSEGAMGRIYRAVEVQSGHQVALKILHSHLGADEDALRRFQREAQILGSLSHENLVCGYSFGALQDGSPYLSMNFVSGRSLAHLVRSDGPMCTEAAIPIFLQICAGIAYAHSRGVIHRDVKPSNVMITSENPVRAKVIDFGVARGSDSKDVQRLTLTGQIVGSLLYMAPELYFGKDADVRSDIYAMGCLMYETLTARTLFQPDGHFGSAQQHFVAPDIVETLNKLNVPEFMQSIVRKAIAPDPRERFQTMDELATALTAQQTIVVNESRQSMTRINPLASSNAAAQSGSRKGGLRRWLLGGVVVCAAVVAIVTFYNAQQLQARKRTQLPPDPVLAARRSLRRADVALDAHQYEQTQKFLQECAILYDHPEKADLATVKQLYIVSARLNQKLKNYPEAENYFRRAFAVDCPFESVDDRRIYLKYFGECLYNNKKFTEGAAAFKESAKIAIDIVKDPATAWCGQADCLLKLGQYDQSYELFEKAYVLRKTVNNKWSKDLQESRKHLIGILPRYITMLRERGDVRRADTLKSELDHLSVEYVGYKKMMKDLED